MKDFGGGPNPEVSVSGRNDENRDDDNQVENAAQDAVQVSTSEEKEKEVPTSNKPCHSVDQKMKQNNLEEQKLINQIRNDNIELTKKLSQLMEKGREDTLKLKLLAVDNNRLNYPVK